METIIAATVIASAATAALTIATSSALGAAMCGAVTSISLGIWHTVMLLQ